MNNITKEWYLFEGFKSYGFEIDGSELLAKKTKIDNVDVVQYNWVKDNGIMVSLAPYYIACSTLDKLKTL